MKKRQHIMMTGGGTLGPVTPLLAIAQAWKKADPDVHVTWVGTPRGPEKELIESRGIPFMSLSAPKLSRHRIWLWPIIPFHFLGSCLYAAYLLRERKPDLIFTAGGFTSVPIVLVAWFLRIPTWVHQLDVKVGLANRLMAPLATHVSATWEASLEALPAEKTSLYGGIVRAELKEGHGRKFLERHGLDADRLTLFVTGGGTGAQSINLAMKSLASTLIKKMNVIHLTGKGKMIALPEAYKDRYVAVEMMNTEMVDALDAADLVVSRAGMGTMMELIALKKPAIFLPIVGSQQEENLVPVEQIEAAVILRGPTPQHLKQEILKLAKDEKSRGELSRRLGGLLRMGAEHRIVKDARGLLEEG